MRLEHLALRRYGHFTDFELDFGQGPVQARGEDVDKADKENQDSPVADLHVLYGPNEAGKSTTLAAINDLLYGFGRTTPWAFLHGYELLEIEATLSQQGQRVGIKRFKNHLSNLNDERLEGFPLDLQGLTREEYTRRFSFDEQSLRDGGEQILQSSGDVGQALFSASAGLNNLKALIDSAMQSANAFWTPRKTNTELKDFKDALQINKKLIAESKFDSSSYKKLQKILSDAKERKDLQSSERDEHQKNINQLETRRSAQGLARQLLLLIEKRNSLVESGVAAPLLAGGLDLSNAESCKVEIEQLRVLIGRVNMAESGLSDLSQRLASNKAQIQTNTATTQDSELLDNREQIKQLVSADSAVREWDKQLLESKTELSGSQQLIDNTLRQMGLPTGTQLNERLPGSAQLATFEELLNERVSLLTKLSHTKAELEQLESAQPEEVVPVQSLTTEMGIATDVLNRIKQDAVTQRYNTVSDALLKCRQSKYSLAEQLNLGGELIANLLLPDENWLDKQLSQLLTLRSDTDQLTQQISTERDDIVQKQQQCEALRLSGAVDSGKLAADKNARDAAWQEHLKQLNAEPDTRLPIHSAQAFENAMRQLDNHVDTALRDTEKSAQLDLLNTQLNKQESSLKNKERQSARLLSAVSEVNTSILKKVSEFYFSATIDATELRQRFNQASKLFLLQAEENSIGLQLEQLSELGKAESENLLKTIETLVPKETVTALGKLQLHDAISQTEKILAQRSETEQTSRQAMDKYTAYQKEHERRTQQASKVQNLLADWDQLWLNNTRDSVLENLSIAKASDALQHCRDLNDASKNLTKAANKQSKLKAQIELHSTSVEALLLSFSATKLSEISTQLDTAAERSSTRSQLKQQQLELTKTLNSKQNALAGDQQLLNSLRSTYAATSNDELIATLSRTEQHRDIQQQCVDAFDHLNKLTGERVEVSDLQSHLSEESVAALESEIQQCKNALNDTSAAYDDANREWALANKSLQDIGDGHEYARLSQERANVLLEIEDKARSTAQARCGHLALMAAISKFRQEHQSVLLTEAKAAFTTLTAGKYINLVPRDDGRGNEQLFAIDDSQKPRSVTELSTGAHYQLYLALRAAAHADYARQRRPLPFIADDIMESFDDERSAAAFKVLNGMAKRGQVIYLTHHKHLLDIARDAVGEDGLQIHHY